MNLFDIVGPVMVGPSSSHTAGRRSTCGIQTGAENQMEIERCAEIHNGGEQTDGEDRMEPSGQLRQLILGNHVGKRRWQRCHPERPWEAGCGSPDLWCGIPARWRAPVPERSPVQCRRTPARDTAAASPLPRRTAVQSWDSSGRNPCGCQNSGESGSPRRCPRSRQDAPFWNSNTNRPCG